MFLDMILSKTVNDASHSLLDTTTYQRSSETETASLAEAALKDAFFDNLKRSELPFSSEAVEDIVPVTSSQRVYLTDPTTVQELTNYLYFDLGLTIDLAQLTKSRRKLWESFKILRTCFLHLKSQMWQVILRRIDLNLQVHGANDTLHEGFDEVYLKTGIK